MESPPQVFALPVKLYSICHFVLLFMPLALGVSGETYTEASLYLRSPTQVFIPSQLHILSTKLSFRAVHCSISFAKLAGSGTRCDILSCP